MQVIRLSETDSTNNYIMQMQREGRVTDDIAVVIADYQSAGRGMGSNTWESEEGRNLLFSILVHPHFVPVSKQYVLSMAAALAFREAISRSLPPDENDNITIKWPNDIYYRDRKLSGTLIDLSVNSQGIKDFVIGTGINVNQRIFLSGAPNPVSLWQIMGHNMSVDELLGNVLHCFEQRYDQLRKGDFAGIIADYHTHLYRRQGFYFFEDAQGRFEASIQEVRPDGIMILRRPDGTMSEYEFKQVKFKI